MQSWAAYSARQRDIFFGRDPDQNKRYSSFRAHRIGAEVAEHLFHCPLLALQSLFFDATIRKKVREGEGKIMPLEVDTVIFGYFREFCYMAVCKIFEEEVWDQAHMIAAIKCYAMAVKYDMTGFKEYIMRYIYASKEDGYHLDMVSLAVLLGSTDIKKEEGLYRFCQDVLAVKWLNEPVRVNDVQELTTEMSKGPIQPFVFAGFLAVTAASVGQGRLKDMEEYL